MSGTYKGCEGGGGSAGSVEAERELLERYRAAGQGQVLCCLDQLDANRRTAFLDQLGAVDLDQLARFTAEMKAGRPVATLDLARLEPPRFIPLPATPGGVRKRNRAIRAGEELLRAGQAAALVVAGGQGTRLGHEGPKGTFPVGPVSGCSLFEWHLSKVLATRRRYGARIPILILTSRVNHEQTAAYLERHGWFGLPHEDVLLFQQGLLPAVDREGRLLLAAPDSLAWSPDGHGGSLSALHREGILDQLEARGILHLFYFQVDNPLVRVLEPEFLGHHLLAGSQMSSKFVSKRDASEKVGVFARAGRRLGVVEYSDLPDELATARDEQGELLYRAGNVAIHVLEVAFIRELTEGGLKLPIHCASKAVPYLDENGRRVEPEGKNCVKFETFVFDALPRARRTVVVEASRAEEFSPVKNATGVDSPETTRADLLRLFRGWIEAAGFEVGAEDAVLEISPLFAQDREEFQARVRKAGQICGERLYLA